MMGQVEKAKDPRGALSRLLGYVGAQRATLALALGLTVIATLFALAGPVIMGIVIDDYILQGRWDGLLNISLILVAIYLAGSVMDASAGWVMAKISQRSLRNLREDMFEHTQTLSLSYFDRTPTGDVMSRLTNDVDAIGTLLSQNISELVRSLLTLVGIVVIMFALNLWLAAASLVVFPFMIAFTAFVGKQARSGFRGLQAKMGALNGVAQETITGQRIVIAFSQQQSALMQFKKSSQAVKELGIKAETYSMLVPPIVGILSNLNIAVVAGVGSWMALQGLATIGIISVFIYYSRKFSDPLRQFSTLYNSIQSALAGAERIFEIMDTKPETEDAPDAVPVKTLGGEVMFENVDFSYVPSVPVLKSISMSAKPGQRIALVGHTGAGKTTIVNVLTRFYDIQSGSITLDGRDIIDIRKDDLRRQLGIVLQDVFLFSGTVMENIRYGRLDASDDECIEAAMLANADGFIKRLPKGFQTRVSERGSNLSQGQRQLINIARAVLSNPSILILDEATSSVDTRTEKHIQEALLRLMEGRTSFVIAHRLSTIRNADLILVIDNGEIVERGTHQELLDMRGFYYRLYMSQFKGTEAN
jgi:ATP-binding cassette subfamily B protein